MTWYRDINPLSEPFDLGGLDQAGRVQLAFEVVATKRPSATFVQELIAILEAADVGTERVNIFATSASTVPETGGPYLSIRVMPGPEPIGTHNRGVGAYRRPSARIVVRAPGAAAAEAMAQAAYSALIACRNREVATS